MLPRIAMVSTYPPTQCGIATFAKSLSDAIVTAGGDVGVISLGDAAGVQHVHRGQRDLMATSQVMSEYDVVVLQHEFGIYDGPDGEEVLAIVAEARPPVITVVHTVPAVPSARQRRILQTLLEGALLAPTEEERNGYVPNVLYSCGSLVHNGYLVIPYGISDCRTSFAVARLEDLLSTMTPTPARRQLV